MAGTEFVSIIGYERLSEYDWDLDSESHYSTTDYYNKNPSELAAEICANYIQEKIYEHEYPETEEGQRAVAIGWLTPEVRAWVEKWMIAE